MLIKLDRKRATALMRLARSDDGALLLEVLKEELDRSKNLLITAGHEAVGRMQGTAQALDAVVRAIETAHEVLRKLDDKG